MQLNREYKKKYNFCSKNKWRLHAFLLIILILNFSCNKRNGYTTEDDFNKIITPLHSDMPIGFSCEMYDLKKLIYAKGGYFAGQMHFEATHKNYYKAYSDVIKPSELIKLLTKKFILNNNSAYINDNGLLIVKAEKFKQEKISIYLSELYKKLVEVNWDIKKLSYDPKSNLP